MSNDLSSYLPTPTKRKFAATFSVVRPISFWIQLGLSAVSFLALFLAIFSRNLNVQATINYVMGFGVFLGVIGLLVVFFRLYWVNRYRRLDKILQSPALPQGVAVYRAENVIRSLDLFVVLANVNLMGAHLVGGATSLGLLTWLDQ